MSVQSVHETDIVEDEPLEEDTATGDNEPITDNTYYLVAVHYRQNIHSDYLFMDLIPQVTYHKENDYHSEFSLTIRMEMVFRG